MDVELIARDVQLSVPNYVQRERSARSWFSTLVAAATSRLRREYRVLLEDVDFSIKAGDRLGLLGRNGAGKTTLLRVLAGSLQPTRGEVQVRGSRQALLNLGLGFHPEATLKENIYLRGTAMGLRPTQIRDLIDPVLEFAELSAVANHRLATLSSGQRMRLGFSVSTAVQHDIMLLDEWFGAGDADFIDRARARMSDRVAGSKIVVLASHNLNMIRQVCNVGLVMEGGRVHFQGPIEEAISSYKAIYQSSEEYQSNRKVIEQEADRLVKRKVREIERENKKLVREQLDAFREQKQKLKEQRDQLRQALRESRAKRPGRRERNAVDEPQD